MWGCKYDVNGCKWTCFVGPWLHGSTHTFTCKWGVNMCKWTCLNFGRDFRVSMPWRVQLNDMVWGRASHMRKMTKSKLWGRASHMRKIYHTHKMTNSKLASRFPSEHPCAMRADLQHAAFGLLNVPVAQNQHAFRTRLSISLCACARMKHPTRGDTFSQHQRVGLESGGGEPPTFPLQGEPLEDLCMVRASLAQRGGASVDQRGGASVDTYVQYTYICMSLFPFVCFVFISYIIFTHRILGK